MGKKQRKEISDFTRFKKINDYGIGAIVTIFLSVVMFAVLLFTAKTEYERDPVEGWGYYTYYNMDYLISAIAFALTGVILDIVAGFFILCGRFNSQWASKLHNRLIFGLIGLLLVGPIMYFIFAGIGKKKAKKEQESNPMPSNNNYPKQNPFGAQPQNQAPQSNPFGQTANNSNPFSSQPKYEQ